MGSEKTYLAVVNCSGLPLRTQTSAHNRGWDGDSRPDHNFTFTPEEPDLSDRDSRVRREELNSKAKGDETVFTMNVSFQDGTALQYSCDQKDAKTLKSGLLSATGTAVDRHGTEVFRASGGGTNGIYLRPRVAPDNSRWMAELLAAHPDIRLNQVVMPGSHDAGMYLTSGCPRNPKPEWSKTQQLSVLGQLKAGSRYFDFRPYTDGTHLRVGHFGEVVGVDAGCYGPTLEEVLQQVQVFMEGAGRGECVILKFSHTMSDSPLPSKKYPVSAVKADTVKVVEKILGPSLYRGTAGEVLAETKLSRLAGSVVATFDALEYDTHLDPAAGVLAYRKYSAEGGGLKVYDRYSEKSDPREMIAIQMERQAEYGQPRPPAAQKDYLFLLSWTCTGVKGEYIADIEAMAATANPLLPNWLWRMKGDDWDKPWPNVVYLDWMDPYLARTILAMNG